jgi:hypothetical protein
MYLPSDRSWEDHGKTQKQECSPGLGGLCIALAGYAARGFKWRLPRIASLPMAVRVADIAEYLAGRCWVYDDAFAADLRRLRAAHGSSTVVEALRLLEQHTDRNGHNEAVRDSVERTLARQPT